MGTKKIILVVILIGLTIIGFLLKNSREYNSLTDGSIGLYKVDFNSSDTNFSNAERLSYKFTKLELKSDGSCVFIGLPPQGFGSLGKWEVIGTDIDRRIYLNFNGVEEEVDFCRKKGCILGIRLSVYKNDMASGYKILAFRKIK